MMPAPAHALARPILWLALAIAMASCLSPGEAHEVQHKTESPQTGVSSQYRLEPAHQGLSPPNTRLDRLLWLDWKTQALAIGDYSASKSSPAVDRDKVYVGVDDGRLFALHKESGATAWIFATHRYATEVAQSDAQHYGIHGSPAFDSECVYIGDYDGYLYAIFKDTGLLKWEKKLGGSIGASPTYMDGRIFIAVETPEPNGEAFVLNAADGLELYATGPLGHHAHSSISVDQSRGYFFVGTNAGDLYCFDFVHNKAVWSTHTDGAIKSTPAVANDAVYITSWDHSIYAIDIMTGNVINTFETEDILMSSPSYYKGHVYFGSDDHSIYCWDPATNAQVWSYKTGDQVISSPTIVQESNLLVIGSRDARLYILNLESGALYWSTQLNAGISSVPVAVDDALYVNDDSGTVYRFNSP